MAAAPRPGSLAPDDVGLFTDLYELTMAQAYWREGIHDRPSAFELHARSLPPSWNLLVACGVEEALDALAALRFPGPALDHLRALGSFDDGFLAWLGRFRFRGTVRAVREGTPLFPLEPILVVEAPLAEAQLVETLVMNQTHLGTLLASKGARVVAAAQGRPVLDFGLRRAHGVQAGMLAARAFDLVGVAATSNVLAGRAYGIPVAGTMAHSFVQAHASELDAFRAFAAQYPETILLVDTYDSAEGVRNVVRLAREMGPAFRVRGIRLDSGDLGALAKEARRLLDAAGLRSMTIVASGNLDENAIARLLRDGVPIDGFGVGTRMSVSADQPYLDVVYKLVEVDGRPVLKTSPGKRLLPGRKQVYRQHEGGAVARDVVALAEETGVAGRALLDVVMRDGRRTAAAPPREAARAYHRAELEALPPTARSLEPVGPFPVALSAGLAGLRDRLAAAHGAP